MGNVTDTRFSELEHPVGQPCKCDQNFSTALPFVLIALALVILADKLRSFFRKRKQNKQEVSAKEEKPGGTQ